MNNYAILTVKVWHIMYYAQCYANTSISFIMQLLESLNDYMGLITLCDIMSMSSLAISRCDWLRDDIPCDINVPLPE